MPYTTPPFPTAVSPCLQGRWWGGYQTATLHRGDARRCWKAHAVGYMQGMHPSLHLQPGTDCSPPYTWMTGRQRMGKGNGDDTTPAMRWRRQQGMTLGAREREGRKQPHPYEHLLVRWFTPASWAMTKEENGGTRAQHPTPTTASICLQGGLGTNGHITTGWWLPHAYTHHLSLQQSGCFHYLAPAWQL